ncbi:MAG: DUF1028 domain-containing protein [Thaumarchaeota archaeon]|nr:DUF1028 domain-containing protein [Nitrososphaerota archaeon]
METSPQSGTQSIVAVDRKSGEMGAAALSQSFSVGSRSIWSEPGVGIVVSQGTVEPSYGPLGLMLMKAGKTPAQAVKSLLATDPRPGMRQVMMIDSRGRTVAHTGQNCLPVAGHLAGRGFCVQANFVNAKRGWRSMAVAFRATKGGLAERLVSSLEAGEQAARGARRGGASKSAAIIVVATKQSVSPWEGRVVDLRVENGNAPLKELRALLKVQEAHARTMGAQGLFSRGEFDRGEKEFSKAISLAPEDTELRLWFALGLMNRGEKTRGEKMLRSAIGKGQDWKAILRELVSRGIVDEGAKPAKGASERKNEAAKAPT